MPNIKFSYLYRDGANFKNYNAIIFDNSNDIDLIEFEKLIRSKLIDGVWFYVNEWKLPNLHFNPQIEEIDHAWHEFERVEYSDELLNPPLDLNDFIESIKKTNLYFKYSITGNV